MTPLHVTWLLHVRHDIFTWDMKSTHGTWNLHMGLEIFTWDLKSSHGTWNLHMGPEIFTWDLKSSHGTWNLHMGHEIFTWDMTPAYVTWLKWRIHFWNNFFTWDSTLSQGAWLLEAWHDSNDVNKTGKNWMAIPDRILCDMTPSHWTWRFHMWHQIFTRDVTSLHETWLLFILRVLSFRWLIRLLLKPKLLCVIWLIYIRHDSCTRDMTHYVCDSTPTYVTWLIHMWHGSFICDMTHSYVTWLMHTWRDSGDVDQTGSIWIAIHKNALWDMKSSRGTWLLHMGHD